MEPLLSGWNTLKGNPHSLVFLKWELRFSVPKRMDECGVVPSSAYGVHANLHLRVRDDFLKVNARSALQSFKWEFKLKVGDCELVRVCSEWSCRKSLVVLKIPHLWPCA